MHTQTDRTAHWDEQAACKNAPADLFFPNRGNCIEAYQASLFCQACPVRRQCLNDAQAKPGTSGVWGGEWFDDGTHRPISNPKNTMDRSKLARARRSEALGFADSLEQQGLTPPRANRLVAARFGVTVETARDWLRIARKERDAPTRPERSESHPRHAPEKRQAAIDRFREIRHLYESDTACARTVAGAMGVHEQTVFKWVRRDARQAAQSA